MHVCCVRVLIIKVFFVDWLIVVAVRVILCRTGKVVSMNGASSQLISKVIKIVFILSLKPFEISTLPFQGFEVGRPVSAFHWSLLNIPGGQIFIEPGPSSGSGSISLIWIVAFQSAAGVFRSIRIDKGIFHPVFTNLILPSGRSPLILTLGSINLIVVIFIGVMAIQFLVDIGPLDVAWVSFDELMLQLIESHFAFFERLLAIVFDVCGLHFECFLQNAVEVEFVGQFDIEVDPSFAVPFMDVPQAIYPHLVVIFGVSIAVGVDNLTQSPVCEGTVYPLHLLRAYQDAVTFKLTLLKLADVPVPVAEILLPEGLQL